MRRRSSSSSRNRRRSRAVRRRSSDATHRWPRPATEAASRLVALGRAVGVRLRPPHRRRSFRAPPRRCACCSTAQRLRWLARAVAACSGAPGSETSAPAAATRRERREARRTRRRRAGRAMKLKPAPHDHAQPVQGRWPPLHRCRVSPRRGSPATRAAAAGCSGDADAPASCMHGMRCRRGIHAFTREAVRSRVAPSLPDRTTARGHLRALSAAATSSAWQRCPPAAHQLARSAVWVRDMAHMPRAPRRRRQLPRCGACVATM